MQTQLGRLLIVDDEVELLASLVEVLTKQGFQVTGVPSGEEAIAALGRDSFDLLLSDLMMPGMDGIELLRISLEVDPQLVCVMMTGHGTVETAVQAMSAGAFDFVLKPFKIKTVLPVLARGLEMRRLRLEIVQLRDVAAIHELTEAIAFAPDLDILLAKAADAALQQCAADEASILLPTPDGEGLVVAAVRGEPSEYVLGEHLSMDDGVAGWVARKRETVTLHSETPDPRFGPGQFRPGIHASITMPMLSGGKLVGVLAVDGTNRHRPFSPGQVKALGIVASAVAPAVEVVALSTQRKRAEEMLRQAHDVLELAVEERTAELRSANAELREAKLEADRANQSKSDFLSCMSHELRTPLNAILGFGEILQMRDKLDDRDTVAVAHIVKGGRYLLALINEVLDIARIESGRLSLSPEPIRVAPVIAEILESVRPLATPRAIEIVNSIGENDRRHVLGDQQLFKQVMLNLLSNAIKYNRDGGKVSLSCEENDGRLRLSVSDTGSGLTAEELAKLFVPFERLGAANSQIEGTGLGLILSKRLIEAMGGGIGVSSVPLRGSVFWVELPLTQSQNDQLRRTIRNRLRLPIRPRPKNSQGDETNRRYTVLYIEDNLSNLQLVEAILAEVTEIRLIPAMQGGIGLELAREHNPDLILLDLHLPDIPGEQVLRRLRAEPKTCEIPVIVLSAEAMPDQIARLRDAGIEHYLTKPIDLGLFLQALQDVFAKSASLDQSPA